MPDRLREATAPSYLLLCLLVGGSAQGIWGNMLLQLLGLAIIAWAASTARAQPLALPAKQLLMLAAAAMAWVALQLIPLPASLWADLGGREELASGYRVLGLPPPALPISVTPHKSLGSLLSLIPPLAIFCATVRLKAYRPSWLALAVLGGAIAGILLGALQVTPADPLSSPWYLYAQTNRGAAVGFFANANHMAILLVICLPFLAALLAAGRHLSAQRRSTVAVLVAVVGVLVVAGIALNGSLAAYGLAVPVILASLLIILPPASRSRPWLIGVAGALLLGILVLLTNTTTGGKLVQGSATSVQSREVILDTTSDAIRDFMPLGSGVGSFRDLYHLYERPSEVTNTYVVHVHNDFVELALETGVPGVVLMLLFLAWWGAAVWRVWQSAEAGFYARAASIASAAILVHSLVDFPLRTAAISVCFGMCLALIADRRPPLAAEKSDLRPTRHFVVR